MAWRETRDSTIEASTDRLGPGSHHRRGLRGEPSSRRVVGRRRALPSARVVVGAFLVAGAALVVFAGVVAGAGGGSDRNYVVAARSLPAGSLIEPSDLSMKSMYLPSTVSGSVFPASDRLVGRTVAVPVPAGELIEASMLTPVGAGNAVRPVTVAADPASLGTLAPGEPVDVLQSAGSQGSTSVSVVVRGATLIGVSRGSSGLLSNPTAGVVTIGVATLDEVEAVIAASHSGTLTLVAAEPSDGVGPGAGGAGSVSNSGAGGTSG